MFAVDHPSVYISHYDSAAPIRSADDAFTNNIVFIIITQFRATFLSRVFRPVTTRSQFLLVLMGDTSKVARRSIVLKALHNRYMYLADTSRIVMCSGERRRACGTRSHASTYATFLLTSHSNISICRKDSSECDITTDTFHSFSPNVSRFRDRKKKRRKCTTISKKTVFCSLAGD